VRGSLLIAIVLTLVFSTAGAAQETEAPFGLSWGASTEQVKSLGVDLKQPDKDSFGETYSASNLPKGISDQQITFLSFGNDNKLWRIAAISTPFENDPYGNSGKNRYSELVGILSEKYGKGHSVHHLGESIYADANYFVAGIRGGESQWFTDFETPTLFIQLGLVAQDSSTLRWRVIYENKALKEGFEQSQKSREKGSL
jgi:hypothetical protein